MNLLRFATGMLSLCLVAGCYNEDKFTADNAQATCEWWDRCDLLDVLDYDDVVDCVTEVQSEAEDGQGKDGICPNFDSSAAKSCVKEIEERGCEDGFDTPSICADACTEAE